MNELDKALAPKSDQLNADDLLGVEKTVTIAKVTVEDTTEQPISIYYEGDNGKPYKPCKSMGRVLRYVWQNDYNSWAGKSMTLFNDTNVTWAGVAVGGIRISHVSGITRPITMPLAASKSSKKPYTVKPLGAVVPVVMAEDKFIEILTDIEQAEAKSDLTALNIAQYKGKISDQQAKQLREAYKTRLQEIKKETEEELPV